MSKKLSPETYFLVSPTIVKSARVHKLPFKLTGHNAFTFRNHIFTMRPDDQRLIMHELVHVAQYKKYGTIDFLKQYFSEYKINKKSGLSKNESYRMISFEVAAREIENDWLKKTKKA